MQPPSVRSAGRLWLLAGLGLLEPTLLFLRFSTYSVWQDPDPLRRLVGRAHLLSYVVITVCAAVVVFAGNALAGQWRSQQAALHRPRRVWPAAAAHGLAFAAFYWLTAFILEGPFDSSPLRALWFALWLLSGTCCALLLLLLALPAAVLRSLAAATARPLAAALAVGLAGFAAGQVTPSFWEPLGRGTLWVSYALLRPFTDTVRLDAAEFFIGTPNFTVKIVRECSGYEGIGLIWVFLGGFLWLFRDRLRFPQAWLLVLLGTAAMWLANAVRIAALVALGTWVSGPVASDGFHSKAGWLLFCGVALGCIALARRSPFFSRDAAASRESGVSRPAAAYLLPLLGLLATALVTGAFASGVDPLHPLRILVAAALLLALRRQYPRVSWSPSFVPPLIGVAVAAVWLLLDRAAHGGGASTVPPDPGLSAGATAVWWTLRAAGYVLVVPIVEELAFRGYLTRRLMAADFTAVAPGSFSWLSFAVSSLLFGALHQQLLAGTLAGLLFALALYRRRRLGDAIVAHATANALLALWAITTGGWSAWG